jgi:hypothetical protein
MLIVFHCKIKIKKRILQERENWCYMSIDVPAGTRFLRIYDILPLFQNIRCFRFMKQMYLDTF